ncbi:MAG: HEPN domain-containing protein [Verrucomicrobiales bacterium]
MSRNYHLTQDQETVTGMFWLPEDKKNSFPGRLSMELGKRARLETAQFNYGGWSNMFPGAPKSMQGEKLHLQGQEVTRAMRAPSHQVIHGHDEHGKEITLMKAISGGSGGTLAMSRQIYDCHSAVFGALLTPEHDRFSGLRLRVDHLDEWVGRCAFQHHAETYEDHDGKKRLAKLTVPVAKQLSIPLNLTDYHASQFFCAWNMSCGTQRFELNGKVYLDLLFVDPKPWKEVLTELHRWEWLFSLATRDTLNLSYLELYPATADSPPTDFPSEGCPVWIKRRNSSLPAHPKRTAHDFHFTFQDVESQFADLVGRWQRLQITNGWEAVLHRFFAVTCPRNLYSNEQFLFLAQAVESMHRGRYGSHKQNVDLQQAAKTAWENAPHGLQQLIGKKKAFQDRFRKTRNYWTHYGEPGPATDEQVLDDLDLIKFSQNLRFLIEAALLQELGVPESYVEKVWSGQWRAHWISF